jgi:hypothetical protein
MWHVLEDRVSRSKCLTYIVAETKLCEDQSKYFSFLFTEWNRVLLEKLIVVQLVNKFPCFCGNRRFIIVFTRARHSPVSWARLIKSKYFHLVSLWSILLSAFHLCPCLPSGLFVSGFPTFSLYYLPDTQERMWKMPTDFHSYWWDHVFLEPSVYEVGLFSFLVEIPYAPMSKTILLHNADTLYSVFVYVCLQ